MTDTTGESQRGVDWAMRFVSFLGRQSWLRLGIRRRIVKLFYPPVSLPERSFSVDFRGLRYDGSFSSIIDWHVFFFGGYELAELDVIEDVTAGIENCASMDVGGNTGHHTLVIAKHSGRVDTFEPLSLVRSQAERHVARNSLAHVRIHPFGLAAETASIPYHYNSTSRNKGTGSFVITHNPTADQHENLQIVRGDDWAAESGLAGVDFIKIDVEGFEAEVLAGLSGVLAKHQPFILVEITQTAFEGFEKHGGFARLIPYPAKLYRVARPAALLGVFNAGQYRLLPIADPTPETNSYNVLVAPDVRAGVMRKLRGWPGAEA